MLVFVSDMSLTLIAVNYNFLSFFSFADCDRKKVEDKCVMALGRGTFENAFTGINP